MTAVEQVLSDIRTIATDEHDKGDRFERMMLHAFQTDRTFRHDTFPAFPLTISLRMTHDTCRGAR
jgi:predicted helicase